jgi:type IV pilus assembly protein PilM
MFLGWQTSAIVALVMLKRQSYYMQWFKRKPECILGIDISTAAIKLVELSQTSDGYKVESYAIRSIPDGVLVNNDSENMQIIAEAIRDVLKQAGTRINRANIAIAESDVFRKIISISSSFSDSEMEERIIIDADQYIPYPLEDVRFDFEVLSRDEQTETAEVLLVAARMENIDERVAILALAGITTKAVDVETFVMAEALVLLMDYLPNKGIDQTTAIIDIGASVISLNVVKNGQSLYARDQAFGGQQLTERIQRIYGDSFKSVETTNIPEGYKAEVLEPFKRAIVQQVARALQVFYSSTAADKSIDSIVFAGGCASIAGIAELVEMDQKCPVLIANPFLNMKVAKKVNKQSLYANGPALMVACGLALRSFS